MAGRPKSVVKVEKPDVVPGVPAMEPGAGGCLKFLQDQELKARQPIIDAEKSLSEMLDRRVKNLRADDGKTPEEWDREIAIAQHRLAFAHDEHKQCYEGLLKYEKAVEPSKRDLTERISQVDAGRNLTLAVVHLRFGWEQIAHTICQEGLRCKTEIEFYAKIKPLFNQSIESAIETAVNEKQIDEWASKAMKEGL